MNPWQKALRLTIFSWMTSLKVPSWWDFARSSSYVLYFLASAFFRSCKKANAYLRLYSLSVMHKSMIPSSLM